MDDLISRQDAIDALNVGTELLRRVLDDADVVGTERAKYEWGLGLIESYISDMEDLPSAQPEFYDYSDIEPLWKSFAEEKDINLSNGAKQLKDAMWVGYRKGKASAQPEKTGKWIETVKHYKDDEQEYDYIEVNCSECGVRRKIGWRDARCCPNCGVKIER